MPEDNQYTDGGDGRHIPISAFPEDGSEGVIIGTRNGELRAVDPADLGGGGGGGSVVAAYVADVAGGPSVFPTNEGTPDLNGLKDYDGVTGVDGLKVFLTPNPLSLSQSRLSGPWIMREGAWERPEGWEQGEDFSGRTVYVTGGDTYNQTTWKVISNPSVAGTDRVRWSLDFQSATTNSSFDANSIPYSDGRMLQFIGPGEDGQVLGFNGGSPAILDVPSPYGYAQISGLVPSDFTLNPDEFIEFDLSSASADFSHLPGVAINTSTDEITFEDAGLYDIYLTVGSEDPLEDVVRTAFVSVPGPGNVFPASQAFPLGMLGRINKMTYQVPIGSSNARIKLGLEGSDTGGLITSGTTVWIIRVV